jgi:hypothetical protein
MMSDNAKQLSSLDVAGLETYYRGAYLPNVREDILRLIATIEVLHERLTDVTQRWNIAITRARELEDALRTVTPEMVEAACRERFITHHGYDGWPKARYAANADKDREAMHAAIKAAMGVRDADKKVGSGSHARRSLSEASAVLDEMSDYKYHPPYEDECPAVASPAPFDFQDLQHWRRFVDSMRENYSEHATIKLHDIERFLATVIHREAELDAVKMEHTIIGAAERKQLAEIERLGATLEERTMSNYIELANKMRGVAAIIAEVLPECVNLDCYEELEDAKSDCYEAEAAFRAIK